jgi:hypothetical protein
MLMRFDPFRGLDRMTEEVFGPTGHRTMMLTRFDPFRGLDRMTEEVFGPAGHRT